MLSRLPWSFLSFSVSVAAGTPLSLRLPGLTFPSQVTPGIRGRFRGGVRDNGELRSSSRNLRSYIMRVPERSTTKYYFIQYFFRYVQVAVYKLWVSI